MLGTFGGALILDPAALAKIFPVVIHPALLSILVLISARQLYRDGDHLHYRTECSKYLPAYLLLIGREIPASYNEISGLMIMAVSGGAVIPLLIAV